MNKRREKWTEEDDQFLFETVMEYVGNGDTKTSAFMRAGASLGRTPSACQYRWNAHLKQRNINPTDTQLLLLPPPQPIMETTDTGTLSMDSIIQYLQTLKNNSGIEELLNEKEALLEQQAELKKHSFQLLKKYDEKKSVYQKLVEQYVKVLAIFEEAEDLIPKDRRIIH